jgi:hypothetical protein
VEDHLRAQEKVSSMAMRTPTPELIDAMRPELEKHEASDTGRRIPRWVWALVSGVVIVAAAIIWRGAR